MALDVATLFICELYVLLFLIVITAFAWSGAQYDKVLGFNSISLIVSVIAVWLSSLRNEGLLFWSVAVGNICVLLAYGLLLSAFRAFRGARCGWDWTLGMVLWGVLCLFPWFWNSMHNRILVSCLLCIVYTAAMIRELHRARAMLPVTFWPARLLLWIHLLFSVVRAVLDGGIPSPLYGAIGGSTFSVYVILESILIVIGMSFTLMAMVNERTQIKYKQASLLDPLTGVWNRRALFEKADQLAHPAGSAREVTVMLFDLDHFKSINDRFGHYHGDQVLIDFCHKVCTELPTDSFFARLGGEEFAAIVLCNENVGMETAERIRQTIEASRPQQVHYSVSIGVASSAGGPLLVDSLLAAADDALYQAKAAGRNQIKIFRPDEQRLQALPAAG